MRLFMGTVVLAVGVVGCASVKTLEATGGSRSDGTVELSYECGSLEAPQVQWEQDLLTARERRAAWGYPDAEAFGGQKSTCQVPGTYSCLRFFVTVTYQCIGGTIAADVRGPQATVPVPASTTTRKPASAQLREISMATEQRMHHCKRCSKATLHVSSTTSHVLHFLLSIPTFGAWMIVWLFMALFHNTQSECTLCRKNRLALLPTLLLIALIMPTIVSPIAWYQLRDDKYLASATKETEVKQRLIPAQQPVSDPSPGVLRGEFRYGR